MLNLYSDKIDMIEKPIKMKYEDRWYVSSLLLSIYNNKQLNLSLMGWIILFKDMNL